MNHKEICEVFADAIASSQSPHSMWKDLERRTVVLTDEFREALCTVMADTWCGRVGIGSYDCQTQLDDGVCVDYCLAPEIMHLKNAGVQTIGCCCGHCKHSPYIQVTPDHVAKMLDLGYEQAPVEANGDGLWCFTPKVILPKEKETDIDD